MTSTDVQRPDAKIARPIWVFAEERSGSTWLTDTLCLLLNRRHAYIEMDREEIDDDGWAAIVGHDPVAYSAADCVFQTHRFAILKSVCGAPMLLRTTRRNRLEHVLSALFLDRIRQATPEFWRFPHVFRSRGTAAFQHVVRRASGSTVEQHEIETHFAKMRSRDALWNEYSKAHDAQTIFYEDLFLGVQVPALRLSLSFSMPSDYIKLPYDKRSVFSNYEQIVEWVGEHETRLAQRNF